MGLIRGFNLNCPCSNSTSNEPIEMVDGAIDIRLSWTCANNINMDLTMEGPRDIVKQDVKDVENLGLEHAYVESADQIRPGDLFTLNAKGNKLEESELEESYLDTNPIDIYAVLRTPTGTYFEQYEAKDFKQLNIGDFAEIEVKDKIEPKWVCPVFRNPPEPNWYNLRYKDREGYQCIRCEEKSNIKWREPVFKDVWRFNSQCQLEQVKVKVSNGVYYCDTPKTCPDSPSYHDLDNPDTGKKQCLYCPKPNTVRWRPTEYLKKRITCREKSKEWEEKINGTWYCDSQPTRTYDECKDEEKKSSCGCVPCEYIVKGMRNVLEYGPIEGANVKIVDAQDYGHPNASVIYKGTTTVDKDIFKTGLINLSATDKAKFDDEKYYVISAKGGEDVDRDDDLIRDSSPTVNNGTIHAIIKGSDIKQMSFRVNVLTEAIFQVSGGAIGSEYNATILADRLDDAAKKLLNTKLYPTDVNQEIVYRDVLLWAPAVDKKALYKPYDTFVEPIVLKTYGDSPRFDESYTLIYEPFDSSAPLLTPLTIEIPEGLPNNTPIGAVVVQNDKTFANVELEGKYSEYFSVDNDGMIRIAQSSSIHNGHNYRFQMRAIDSSGREGSFVGLTIQVGAGIHQANLDASIPSLVSVETFEILENSPEGTLVANIVFEDSNQTIVGYRLIGDDNNSFAVDDQGIVTVSANADIDYEKSKIYRFSISAYNDAGNESFPVQISINVNNEIDTPLYPLVFLRHLEENTPIGTIIGRLETLREGLSTIDSFDILSPDIPFNIDNNGTITVSDYVDYEQDTEFEFIAIAYTKHGKSNKIQCQIIVDNQDPEIGIPSLEDLTISVDENTTSGSKIGQLVLDAGATALERIALYGEDDNFRVDVNGSLYLADDAMLDYETKTRYDLGARALNSRGWGNEVHIVIEVNNIADQLPTLEKFKKSVEENATAGTLIGHIMMYGASETTIDAFELTGTGNENFSIDTNGTIRVSQTAQLDYESKDSYLLKAIASSAVGSSSEVEVIIYILNIPENPPTLKPLTLNIEENANIGTVLGKVQEDVGGDSPIVSYTLDDNSTFSIDANGTVRVEAPLDYETQTQYTLQVTASNVVGESNPASVTVNIVNIPDGEPVLEASNFSVEENSPLGTVVGTVNIDSATPVSDIYLSGFGSENFTIDINGTIRVAQNATLDYEQYRYYASILAHASNQYGTNKKLIRIDILDIVDSPPEIGSLSNNTIPENSKPGTEVGKVSISSEVPVTNVVLSGTGSKSFTIDINGTIRVAEGAILDYDVWSTRYLRFVIEASNKFGTNSRSVTISLSNVPDPTLYQTSLWIDENSVEGTVVGTARIDSDEPLLSVSLTGVGSENFTIDNNGTIRVAKDAVLDYESTDKYDYNIRLHATNAYGTNSTRIYVNINNIPDTPPLVSVRDIFMVEDGQDSSRSVGGKYTVSITSDSSVDSVRLEGENANDFTIDTSGTIHIAEGIVIDINRTKEYNLGVIAKNSFGESKPVEVIIKVHNKAFMSFSSKDNEQINDIVMVDLKKDIQGNIYVFGYRVKNNENTPALIKYDNAQNIEWIKDFNATVKTENDYIYLSGLKLYIDGEHTLYLLGDIYGGTLENSMSDDNQTIGNRDVFAIALDTNGTSKWIKQFGTSGNDSLVGMLMEDDKLYVAVNIPNQYDVDNNASTLSEGVVYILDSNGSIQNVVQFDEIKIEKIDAWNLRNNYQGFIVYSKVNNIDSVIKLDSNFSFESTYIIDEEYTYSAFVFDDVAYTVSNPHPSIRVVKHGENGEIWSTEEDIGERVLGVQVNHQHTGTKVLFNAGNMWTYEGMVAGCIGYYFAYDMQGQIVERRYYGLGYYPCSRPFLIDGKIYLLE